jgi:hypothetical protein
VLIGEKYDGEYRNNTHPIDVVYTWVDSSDLNWQQQRDMYYKDVSEFGESDDNTEWRYPDVKNPDIELDMSLKLLFKYAKWVRNVYIVASDGQVPSCINKHNGKIKVVHHSEIWPKDMLDDLPVFNSHAIEANLHRIPGLSELFIYFNDDMYLGDYLDKSDCFSGNKAIIQKMGLDHAGNLRNIYRMVWSKMVDMYYPIYTIWHGFYTLTKSSMIAAEKSTPQHWKDTIRNKFRNKGDLAPVGYTINHAFKNKDAFLTVNPLKLYKIHDPSVEYVYKESDRYDVICVNYSMDIVKTIENLKINLNK